MSRRIQNAKITAVSLGYEDHGILTAFLTLDYGGTAQGFGGYGLDAPPLVRASGLERQPSAACGAFVAGVLNTLEMREWSKLPGTIIRADSDHGKVSRIGHALKDRWFDPAEAFASLAEPADVAR